MKKILGTFVRAMYQLMVVDIICLPYRLGCLMTSLLRCLMAVSEGASFTEYMRHIVIAKIKANYIARSNWVRYGNKSN